MDILDSDKLPAFPAMVYVVELDGRRTRTLRTFYPRIAKALFFPDYFGKNLDALSDCLASLEVVGRDEILQRAVAERHEHPRLQAHHRVASHAEGQTTTLR